MKKNILVVDDSALMRRALCDIINSDKRFRAVDTAANGLEALKLLKKKSYDAVVLDVNMEVMNGIELLKELRIHKISTKVMMVSSDGKESTKNSLDALELGALDFVLKPGNAIDCHGAAFKQELLRVLDVVVNSDSDLPVVEPKEDIKWESRIAAQTTEETVKKRAVSAGGNKVVAIVSSTGGPKALQTIIPQLPANLNAPVLIVQHMPAGFTGTFAERLNNLSEITVKEAEQEEQLKKGVVFLARGGMHLNIKTSSIGKHTIWYSDEPNREGVKPCANYMYESLADSRFDEVVCVVMTGMGADGTAGIKKLKIRKNVHVIAQNKNTCTVYGMPKSIVLNGLSDQVLPLDEIAQEIILHVGVM